MTDPGPLVAALGSPRLTRSEVQATASWIASVQLPTGMIPWYPGGHADPWNHTEAAMALSAAGCHREAEAAFEWLRTSQQPDGSWCLYHLAEGIEDPRRDPNVAAYVAAGTWWHWLETGDSDFVAHMMGTIDASMDFVLSLQAPGGEVLWSREVDGHRGGFALLTASSSILHSMRCALAAADLLDRRRPDWEVAAARLCDAIAGHPERFEPKDRWAMDWYYPVLSGALPPDVARARLDARWSEFVVRDLGVRCVADHDWVTAAETAELVIALDAVGDRTRAAQLLTWTRHHRDADGAYGTGCVHPQCVRYPGGERSTYSSAAVIMADHVLYSSSPAAAMFRSAQGPGALSPRGAEAVRAL